MSPSAARTSVILLSFLILGLSAVVTSLVWTFLSPLQTLPRGMFSLFAWVSAYYAGTRLVFWKAVLRLSPTPVSGQP
jgi:hypothetical protein